ncbi:hypothetical protein E1265_07800 [Streptomyces sp. 8K308]|uniref:hypothetical protein n=1 Tax=Streptomyces sp. 8K308 TaxID=2530388 RepID=UPI00104C0F4D|nr:hypothetical protein [Streptomyces sp. 8K308]TDC25167.1 hypothetical protein E1265_07800 [Streptomyces sp. 8K308]
MPGPDLGFAKEDVERAAGRSPWRRQEQFTTELDTDDMAQTAAIYARAAEESVNSLELSERASELAAESGELDGATLADGEERVTITTRDLDSRGMEKTVGSLQQAMNLALVAEEAVIGVIAGGDVPQGAGEYLPGRLDATRANGKWTRGNGLDARVQRHAEEAVAEYNGWATALSEAYYRMRAWEYDTPPTIPIQYQGRWRDIQPVIGADGKADYSVEPLAQEVRDRHLRAAADDAVDADEDIVEAIDGYRTRLSGLAYDLVSAGVDISRGPLDLFVTEDMAAWSAERINEAFGPGVDAVPSRIRSYLAGLEGITESVYGGTPLHPARDLTPAERAFLERFYGDLTPHALGGLGNLDTADRDLQGLLDARAVRQSVGDGVNALFDPAVGGIAPGPNGERVPDSIRYYVYDYASHLEYPTRDMVADFDGFGRLMGESMAPSGPEFSRDTAHAAVDIERTTRDFVETDGTPMNEGTRNLLGIAARRPEIAAELLSDPEFAENMLNAGYPTSEPGEQRQRGAEGVSGFVHQAAQLPDGVDPDSAEGRVYADAAYNYLNYASTADTLADTADQPVGFHSRTAIAEEWTRRDPERFGEFAWLVEE